MAVTGPFENRNFRVKWDGEFVPGVSKVSGLQWSTEVVTYRDGASPVETTGPGRMAYVPLALERGVTIDTRFESWAQTVMGGDSVPNAGITKDILIDVFDTAGRLVVSYRVYRCWPSSYEALSVLDGEGNMMLVERLLLQYATFARDLTIVPPAV